MNLAYVTMKILIAPDKFKGTLSSEEAACAVAKGLREFCPQAKIKTLVVSDGGQGFIDALEQAEPLERHFVLIPGPLDKKTRAYFALSKNGKRAYIESCHATGLHLVPLRKRNPLRASSGGLSLLLRHALKVRPSEIYIGLGSSATCDAGLPVARNFGFRFLDHTGRELKGRPEELIRIKRILKPAPLKIKYPVPILYAVSDVFTPPVGQSGGVRTYTPQKGAGPVTVEQLERGMKNLISVMHKNSRTRLSALRGGGAAGCLGLGLHFFFKARILNGSAFIFKKLKIERLIRNSDIVITGEGSFDPQSFQGKITGKIVRIARKHGKKVFLITGRRQIPGNVRRQIEGNFSVEALVRKGGNSSKAETRKTLQRHGKTLGKTLAAFPR